MAKLEILRTAVGPDGDVYSLQTGGKKWQKAKMPRTDCIFLDVLPRRTERSGDPPVRVRSALRARKSSMLSKAERWPRVCFTHPCIG